MKTLKDIIKSPNDKLLYKAFQLPNKLKILFIYDKSILKSAVAMEVGVGSLSDPKEYQGLAHFCEHMLFMGTKKFPKVSLYGDFIS